MNKFKNATKRIVAVAASAALISSSAFAGLGNYPNNFVKDGKFNGQVVVGAAANGADTTAAMSIIDDLKSEFSGSAQKVKITYKSAATGGSETPVLDSGKVMKYGQDLNDVKPTSFDDKDLTNALADGTFKNGVDDEDYEQTVDVLNNGYFEYALRDDYENEISSHLWLEDADVMSYTFSMKSPVNYDATVANWDSDFVGETLKILGNEYTIVSISSGQDSNLDYGITKIELVGGSGKVSLGEGDSTTVTVDGNSYEVSIQSVSTDKVLLTVNGESISIDQYDTEDVAGITIAVTDLVSSNRDSVKGYAEIVVGGSKITLTDGQEVELNDEDISDIYDNYRATVSFSNSGAAAATSAFDGFTVTYTLDDEMLLNVGDSFEDHVFGVLGLRFDGTNDVSYETVELKASSDKLSLSGKLLSGDMFDEDVAMLYNNNAATDTPTVLIGASDDDRLLVTDFAQVAAADFADPAAGSVTAIDANLGLYLEDATDASNDASTDSLTINGQTFTNVANGTNIEVGNYIITVNELATYATNSVNLAVTGINLKEASGMRFITGDRDDQQIYEFGSYSISNEEVDFENIIDGSKDQDIAAGSIASKLDDVTTATYAGAGTHYLTALDVMQSEVLFENEYIVSLEDVAAASTTASAGGSIYVYTDSSDLNADDETTVSTVLSAVSTVTTEDDGDFPAWTFNLRFDITDDMFDVELDLTNSKEVLLSGAEADVSVSNDNERTYVDAYGTMVTVDAEDKEWVKISTPDKQVEANVVLTAGSSGSSVMTKIVDADMVETAKSDLVADGYSIVGTENVAQEAVTFDITAPVTDAEVTGMDDMIVVGGPAVNRVAADLLGLQFPTYGSASGVNMGEAVIRYFENSNSVLVYGYEAAQTVAAANKLNAGVSDSDDNKKFN